MPPTSEQCKSCKRGYLVEETIKEGSIYYCNNCFKYSKESTYSIVTSKDDEFEEMMKQLFLDSE